MVHDEGKGDIFVIHGMRKPLGIALAGRRRRSSPEDLKMFGASFESLHNGGWDPEARLADQDRDGVSCEVIYPTVGMLLCNHRISTTRRPVSTPTTAGWPNIRAPHPDRLIGLGQTAMRSVEEGIEDLRKMKEIGLARCDDAGKSASRRL